MLGVFGSPAETGKPNSGDLRERKATSVVVSAYELADAATRRELIALMHTEQLDDTALGRWRTLIIATGALDRIEDMVACRLASARKYLADMPISDSVRDALSDLAGECGVRSQ